MRIAIVTESFLPQVNGVTNSVLRICEHLDLRGHPALVVAPAAGTGAGPASWAGADLVRVPSVPVPGYGSHRVGFPWPGMTDLLRDFAPDVVHLASPAVLGAQAVLAARRLDLPTVAVYQTDLAAYVGRYRAGAASAAVWQWLGWVHGRASRTLAPSHAVVAELVRRGVPRVHHWPRGVDLERFHPRHRDPQLRAELAPAGEALVGYVGRLAAEKEVHLLAGLQELPGVRLVVAGDGPLRDRLERELPRARFLGLLGGPRLSALFASLDVFVHTGPHETFCQAAQEALASGVPVVAPAAGGLLDLVDDGRTGRLFPAGDGDRLVAAVTDLVADPQLRARSGAAARASVLGRSWEVVGDDYLRHCRGLLAGDPVPAADPVRAAGPVAAGDGVLAGEPGALPAAG